MVVNHLLLSLLLLKSLLGIVAVLIQLLKFLSFIIPFICDRHVVIPMVLGLGFRLLAAFGKKYPGLILFIAIT